MTPGDWIATATSLGSLLLSLGAVFIGHGRMVEKVDNLTRRVDGQDTRIGGIEVSMDAATISINGLSDGIKHLSERWADQQKLSSSELGRVADSVKAGHELISLRLDGIEKLERQELSQVKTDVAGIRQTIHGLEQTFNTRPAARGRAAA